jgi:hypothetical protein
LIGALSGRHDVSVTQTHRGGPPFPDALQKQPPTSHCAKHGFADAAWQTSPASVNVSQSAMTDVSVGPASAGLALSSFEHAATSAAPASRKEKMRFIWSPAYSMRADRHVRTRP